MQEGPDFIPVYPGMKADRFLEENEVRGYLWGGERQHMFPNLNAGTGPAAAILVGAFFAAAGNPAGWVILLGGFGLSAMWALSR